MAGNNSFLQDKDDGLYPENLHRHYRIKLRAESGDGKDITTVYGWLPENFTVEYTANWTPPFAAGFGNIALMGAQGIQQQIRGYANRFGGSRIARNLIDAGMNNTGGGLESLARVAGLGSVHKIVSALAYDGPTPIAVQVPFVFQARTDPRKEVLEQIYKLQRMAAPFNDGGTGMEDKLVPPGPKFKRSSSPHHEKIVLSLGSFFRLSPVVVTSVSTAYECRFGEDGTPHHAKVDVGISTWTALGRKDLEAVYPTLKQA